MSRHDRPRAIGLVSACLVGFRCRYDGADALREEIRARYERGELVAVCPEELGGLGTPRPAAEIRPAPPGGQPWEMPADLGPFVDVPRRGSDVDGREVWEGTALVVTDRGADVTAEYVKGAIEAARKAREQGVIRAYLKSKSPSCGWGALKRDGRRVAGDGVAAHLLARMGIEIVTVE